MRRVAAAVDVTPMAIYRHYPGRASLLNALADEGFADLTARLAEKKFSGSVQARLTRMMEIYLEHALQRPRLFELMFLKPRVGARSYPRDFKAGRSPTANLLAPVVINRASGRAVQAVRSDRVYSHKHPLLPQEAPCS